MPADELADWIAFERRNGPLLAHERLEVMIATLCSLIANQNGARTSPADFIPWRERPRSSQSPEAMIAAIESVFEVKK